MSMQNIRPDDLVRDEYGNHYLVVGIQEEEETLKVLQISNLWYEKSFDRDLEVGNKPVGEVLQERVNAYIEETEKKERPIYAIRDLMVNQISVYAVDITKPHPSTVESG